MKKNFLPGFALLVAIFNLQLSPAHAQGPLTPPGLPASTMKSLDQVQPRTPVDATHTPGTVNSQFAITQPGSYYLTGNLAGISNLNNCILIQTNDVTLDLNGFQLVAFSVFFGNGISIGNGFQNIVIRNGTMRNFNNGVLGLQADNCELDHLQSYGCNTGFVLRNRCLVKNSSTLGGQQAGIQAGNACIMTDCLLASNYDGIFAGADCLVTGCIANANANDGIVLTENGNVSKCTSDSNGNNGFTLGNRGQIIECAANTNAGAGMNTLVFGSIKGCTANANSNGIVVADNSVVADNQASGNGSNGIKSTGSGSRIENNQTRNNIVTGILSNGGPGADVIVRNTSAGNGSANYSPASGTTFAPVQTPSSATSPWANF